MNETRTFITTTAAAALTVLFLAGCAAQPKSIHAAIPTFTAGASAAAMANAITGCKDVAAQPVPSSAKGLSSLAACSLAGFPIQVYSWNSVADMTPSSAFSGYGNESYHVDGATWTVIAGVDGDMAGQKTAMQKVAAAIGGKVVHVTP